MITHVITLVIGIFSCLIAAWLLNVVLENIERGAKADKFFIFWAIYSFVVGVFLIITG